MKSNRSPSRRDFIKLAGLGLGALAFETPHFQRLPVTVPQFKVGDYLGRVAVFPDYFSTALRSQPNENSTKIRDVGQDEVVLWQREVIGANVSGRTNTRWVETPDGFIYAPTLQPVRYFPNTPITSLPEGKSGFWAEVTVPFVELVLRNSPIGEGVKYLYQNHIPIRLYYGQVAWIDKIEQGPNGIIFYRFNESPQHGYGPGDVFSGDGTGFHVLTNEDIAPINPNVDPKTKKIVVDATKGYQTLSCFEGKNEVYFCRVSTGFSSTVQDFSTPVGDQTISWKIYSIHMGANLPASGSGYDTMAVPWPVFFNTNVGAAIHGVFWHNDFGVRRSHGCVNASPEDAKWIFRWSSPSISLDQSEIRLQYPNDGSNPSDGKSFSTIVTVNETKA